MNPEELVKQEIITLINDGLFLAAYIRLMEILDPDMKHVAQLVEEVRKHGHGQVVVNIGKGKINSATESLSHII